MATIKWWSAASMSGGIQPGDFPGVAVHAEAVAGTQQAGGVRAYDGGDAEVARDNRAVREDAAAFDDEGSGVDEERRPAGIGGRADEHIIAAEIGENGLQGSQTLASIHTRAQQIGLNVSRDDNRFVMEVISEAICEAISEGTRWPLESIEGTSEAIRGHQRRHLGGSL